MITPPSPPSPAFYDAAQVDALLDYRGCIGAMRDAMIALSHDAMPQPLRQIVTLASGGLFGVMPGELAAGAIFGAKLVSVFADPEAPGRTRHQGLIVVHDAGNGALCCVADAEAVTRIRTASMTAAATDALARPDARVLAIFGTGLQARSHLAALTQARHFERVLIWGRNPRTADMLAQESRVATGHNIEAVASGREAAEAADVICTVSNAKDPILFGEWVRPGTHVNLVGSSHLGPVETDTALVASARYIADYRASAIAQASELAVARAAGALDDTHIAGEIGQVFGGTLAGRETASQITLFKSLGHVVQDLAAVNYLHKRAQALNG